MKKRIIDLINKIISLKVLVALIFTALCIAGVETEKLYILLAVWGTVLGTREIQKITLLLKGNKTE
jgi:hypothetical protein